MGLLDAELDAPLDDDEVRIARWKALAVNLLPRGLAWARALGSNLTDLLGAAICEFARVEEMADIFYAEMNPSQAVMLLPEWERAFSLPDECGSPTTTQGRQASVVARLTGGGTTTADALAVAISAFDSDTELTAITHPTQFEVGTDGGGAGQPVGADEWANVITLTITTSNPALDEAGLECVLNGIKRGHGHYLFEHVFVP